VNNNTLGHWAKSLLGAAIFASFIGQTNAFAADQDRSIAGFADTAGAFLDVGAYRPARLIVYQTDTGALEAFTVFQAGGYTFGFAPQRGSHFCALPWNTSDQALANNWCHRPIRWTTERTRSAILAAGIRSKAGDYENGCLVDSLLAFERLPQTNPKANWEGVFLLFHGVQEFGGGHAVCVSLIGNIGWVYDPVGRQNSCLGPITLQATLTLVRKLDPQASSGGWLETRDLAWLKRHAH
jgi:hypothetical protein